MSKANNSGEHRLPPFPEGWYLVELRREIAREKLISRNWMGQQIVAWLDEGGEVRVADAYCPHMGAHLGPQAGGKVCQGRLVCPFHGFEFNGAGHCVSTPNAPPPARARLQLYETCESEGMVFAWWGHHGRPAQFELPKLPHDPDWSPLGWRRLEFRSHPQETSENSVDLGHLRAIHGYRDVYQIGAVEVNGAHLLSKFHFFRERKIAGIFPLNHDVTAEAHVHGLGYSLVRVREHTIGMEARLWVLGAMTDGETLKMTLAGQVRALPKPKRFLIGMKWVPRKWRSKLMNEFLLSSQKLDVLQDVSIWETKRFNGKPKLCQADGQIGLYRRYCQQFYPDSPSPPATPRQ